MAIAAAFVSMGTLLAPAQPSSAAGVAVPPTLAVSSWRVELGIAPVGGTSAPQVVTVTNLGPGAATGLAVGAFNQADLTRTTTCGTSLADGASCTITVVLQGNLDPAAPAYRDRRGSLRISSAGGSSPLIDAQGFVGDGYVQVQVNPRYLDLGRVPVGSVTPVRPVTITNPTGEDIPAITLSSFDARFEIVSNGCSTPTPPGGSCTVGLRYRPTAAGTPTASIGLLVPRPQPPGLTSLSTIEVRGGGPLTVTEAFAHRMYAVFFHKVPTWRQVRQLADELEDGSRSKRTVVHDFLWSYPWLELQVIGLLYFDARIDYISAPKLAKPYIEAIQGGRRTLASVEIELAGRPGVVEYRGGTDGVHGWVKFMYQFYLGRDPDPAGWAFWTSRATRLGTASVARSFYNDPWSLRRRVDLRYLEALGRQVDPEGIAYWSPRLAKRGDQELGESLALSTEFLRRAHAFPWDEYQQSPD